MLSAIYVVLKLFIDVFIDVTAPIVFAFVPKSADRLPGLLAIYEDYNYGINGDPYWVQPGKRGQPPTEEAARSWRWRVMWCWRNANTIDHWLGLKTRTVVRVEIKGDLAVSNKPGHSGTLRVSAWDKSGREYNCTYRISEWGRSGRCTRFYGGYKLKDLADFWAKYHSLDPALMDKAGLRPVLQRVFTYNPVCGFVP